MLKNKLFMIGVTAFFGLVMIWGISNYFAQQNHQNTGLNSHSQERNHDFGNNAIEVLKDEMRQLKEQNEALRNQAQQMGNTLTQMRSNLQQDEANNNKADKGERGSASTPNPYLSEKERQQRLEEESKAVFAMADNKVLSEEVDTNWSYAAQERLSNRIQDPEFQDSHMQLEDVQCKTTVCKLSIRFTSPESPDKTMDNLSYLSPWDGESLMQISADGSTALVYLSREGYGLSPESGADDSEK